MNVKTLPDYNRYVLTSSGGATLVFPDKIVAEIILVERSYLLHIPFFNSAMLGVIQHSGVILPLISLRRALGEQNALIPEKITVIHLSDLADNLAGIGLVIDKVLGSVSSDEYKAQFKNQMGKSSEYLRIEHLLPQLPAYVWQPQRWHPLSNTPELIHR